MEEYSLGNCFLCNGEYNIKIKGERFEAKCIGCTKEGVENIIEGTILNRTRKG